MQTLTTIPGMMDLSNDLHRKGLRIGFVPTMGALHEGHMSLVRSSVMESGVTVASIFVNPAQFGPSEDFEQYPRMHETDSLKLSEAGCDVLLLLNADEMYPDGFDTWVEVGKLSKSLCGRHRPIHFRGVCTVVTKLFNIVRPHRAYFGWKDAQQALILRRMTADLNFGIEIVVNPTVRDTDGLALSSRNCYLSIGERKTAHLIPEAIRRAEEYYREGGRDAGPLLDELHALFRGKKDTEVDYISLVRTSDLEDVPVISKDTLLALAVRIGSTRLIDNHLFADDEPCSER